MRERVLIIDDEENIRQMLRLTLETADKVGEAGDGMEAFAILGGDPAWNVILLDQRPINRTSDGSPFESPMVATKTLSTRLLPRREHQQNG